MKKMIFVGLCMLVCSSQAYAVCMGTISASTPRVGFIIHMNGTVTHNKSGLMWKQCSEGLSGANCAIGTAVGYTWQGALQQAQNLNAAGGFAGFTDWRVPNIKELTSIVEEQCTVPAINAVVFPATISNWYWSSSPKSIYAKAAWVVNFSDGGDNFAFKNGNSSVRLVRGGQ